MIKPDAPFFTIVPLGVIHKGDRGAAIEIYPEYGEALLGVDGFSHLMVFYWFHQNDTPEKRNTLQVHPRRHKENPLTGVFGTHSPARPNLIALSFCKKLSIENNTIFIDKIDALDGSPLIDIKPYIPLDDLKPGDVKLPAWV
jgi:tRNA-Thr(GGU) m(6)t(6)A37 methyltransferase TsaA